MSKFNNILQAIIRHEQFRKIKAHKEGINLPTLQPSLAFLLVLFMLGLLGLILLNVRQISDHVKENYGFSINFKARY